MKCTLLLLLLGAFCVAEGARLTLADAKQALDVGWRKYLALDSGRFYKRSWNFQMNMAHGTVSGDCTINRKTYRRGRRTVYTDYMNCGLDPNYQMNAYNYKKLKYYFENRVAPNGGELRPPQCKSSRGCGGNRPGVYKVNALYHGRRYTFNFHVPVDGPSPFAMRLLSLLLE